MSDEYVDLIDDFEDFLLKHFPEFEKFKMEEKLDITNEILQEVLTMLYDRGVQV